MTHQDSNRLPFDRKVLTRFFSKIKISTEHFYNGDPCWDWTGGKNNKGYGMFSYRGKNCYAHRIAYEMFVEIIPPGLKGDHLCRRPICVNPAHKEPVTHRINVLRGTAPSALNHKKTVCKRGHPLSGDNLRTTPSIVRGGRRACRTCSLAWHRVRGAVNRRRDGVPERAKKSNISVAVQKKESSGEK